MKRLSVIGVLIGLVLAGSAQAQERGHESGRVVAALYEATPVGEGAVPGGYLSRALRGRVRSEGWPEGDWLRGSLTAEAVDRLYFVVLNTTGASATRPASASVSVWLRDDDRFGRQFRLIREGGKWVVDDVCLFPERYAMSELIAAPEGETPQGPTALC